MSESVFVGTWTPEDRRADLYRSLEFEVDKEGQEVHVALDYVKGPGQALDLGLFGPDGFRGWSGSSKKSVVVGPASTTPGYLPGPIPRGRWHVELGLHRIPPAGLAYEVRVDVVPVGSTPREGILETPTRVRVPISAGMRSRSLPALPGHQWLAGDFHVHSHHSDGTESVHELARRATQAGLDFLAVTDFNTVSHLAEVARENERGGIQLLGGQTVALDTGHAVVLGTNSWIDLRSEPAEWAAKARSAGCLISVNHPVKAAGGWRTPLPFLPDLAEVWNGAWDRHDEAPLAWWLAAGQGVAAIGGSDWHGPEGTATIGRPVTWVQASGEDVLAGLRAKRTAVSASLSGPLILRVRQRLHVLDAEGHELMDWEGRSTFIESSAVSFPALPTPYVLREPNGAVVAIAN